jgi:putative Holliday junction resolvase
MNEDSSVSPHVKGFVRKLKEKFPELRIERIDERFTSQMAQRAMLDGGLKKKDRQNKSTVNKISAVLILQTWMQANQV